MVCCTYRPLVLLSPRTVLAQMLFDILCGGGGVVLETSSQFSGPNAQNGGCNKHGKWMTYAKPCKHCAPSTLTVCLVCVMKPFRCAISSGVMRKRSGFDSTMLIVSSVRQHAHKLFNDKRSRVNQTLTMHYYIQQPFTAAGPQCFPHYSAYLSPRDPILYS